jgi:hypothetical protein
MNWPALFNTARDISIVGFLGYGMTLLKQQNELLKAEKSLKQSEIDLHKAKIGHLRSLQAPAIARDLEQMSRTADKYAEKKRQLEEKVKAVEEKVKAVEEQVEALEAESAKAGAAAQAKTVTQYILGYAHANVEAIRLLEKSAQMAWIVGVPEIEVQINDGIRRLIEETRSALDSAGNPPSVVEWWKWETKQEGTPPQIPEPDPDF